MNEHIYDVTLTDFRRKVIDESASRPVVVDFWAEWCGPCRMLMPVLHQVVESYQGKVALAKVNTDTEQDLALQYGIRSLPTVALFRDGQIVDQFMGVQPDGSIRQFIEKHLKKEPDEQWQAIQEQIAAGNVDEAIEQLKQRDDDQSRLQLIQLLMQSGQPEEARALWKELPHAVRSAPEAEKLASVIELLTLQEKLTDKPEIGTAIGHIAAGAVDSGVSALLQVLESTRDDDRDMVRQALVNALNLVEDDRQRAVFRRKMATMLFS